MIGTAHPLTRRGFIAGGTAALGAGLAASVPVRSARATSFPSRRMRVYVATREGGGADRNLRAFAKVWKKYLGVEFEVSFYPGAAGRVGYATYMGRAKDDCHELLFGNMGPEVLNWVISPPRRFKFPGDYLYFAQVDRDPSILFVSRRSRFRTIDDVLAEGKKRTLTVGTSRLAHPGSLGALALARHTGARFNLIPLSGGRNTRAGVATGEMDLGVLPSGGIVARAGSFRTLLVFDDKNRTPDRLDDAPTANGHLGMRLPPLVNARAFAIKTAAAAKHPERYAHLQATLAKVFADPDYKAEIEKIGAPWELIAHGTPEDCAEYVAGITKIGEAFKPLLTGKR